jgi:hypothetical protein
MFEISPEVPMSMVQTRTLPAADLFVVLEKAYRRKARNCDACNFSLPFRTDARSEYESNWTVLPSSGCCGTCKDILDDLIATHQASYRLADTLN